MSTTVYFDLDGTLIGYGRSFTDLLEEVIGMEVTEEIDGFWTDQILNNLEEQVEDPYLEGFKALNREFNIEKDPDKLTRDYISTEVEATHTNQRLVELLEELTNHCKVGILTNGDGKVQMEKVEQHKLQEKVDEVIVSNEVGVRKPDLEIFEIAKKRLTAEKYVYIGDTHDEDIIPAKEAGFQTIYISGEQEADIQTTDPETLGEALLNLIK